MPDETVFLGIMLKDKYFKITDCTKEEGQGATYTVSLLSDCKVYDGHFPGEPVCPGVCNIQTVKECAQLLVGEQSLRIQSVKRCRFKALMTPMAVSQVNISINATKHDKGYTVTARIYDAQTEYMDFNGEMTP